jgi:hypothetical protein
MNWLKIYRGLLLVLILGSTGFVFINYTITAMDQKEGFALVELFTSEGCSSCPAADKVIAQINEEVKDERVYILAYHVDYWNRLGWKDIHSNPAFSKRQRTYAEWLGLSGVYTPQIVVNGKKEFVGSNEKALRSAIQTHLSLKSFTHLKISGTLEEKHTVRITFQVDTLRQPVSLLLAFVQKQATSKVTKGENGGRTLSHINIVRKLHEISINNQLNDSIILPLPSDFHVEGWQIVAFLQKKDDGRIVDARRLILLPVSNARKPKSAEILH